MANLPDKSGNDALIRWVIMGSTAAVFAIPTFLLTKNMSPILRVVLVIISFIIGAALGFWLAMKRYQASLKGQKVAAGTGTVQKAN